MRMGLAAKAGLHVVALVFLATTTMLVVHEAPYILEEADGSRTGPSDEELFELLTSSDDTEASHPKSHALQPATISPGAILTEVQPGSICAERGPPSCRNVTTTCVKHGPTCTYDKVCIEKSDKCIPAGICTQPGKKCEQTFSKQCVACAKTTQECQDAHSVAKTCVPHCKEKCMQHAGCEQQCARGCLQKYKALMLPCKKKCKACQKGTKEVCWTTCNEWKNCVDTIDECRNVDRCVKQGKKCESKKVCAEEGQICSKVDECVEHQEKCETHTHCTKYATECAPTLTCTGCQNKTESCLNMKKIKAKCYSDCDSSCSKEDPTVSRTCADECNANCKQAEEATRQLCEDECPVCQQPSGQCQKKCLKTETSRHCHKECVRHEEVSRCHKGCTKHEMKQQCQPICDKWSPARSCQKKCRKWHLSPTRPCEQPCAKSAFQHTCDHRNTKCVQWTGGSMCDKEGPCLRYQDASQALPMPPIAGSNEAVSHAVLPAPGSQPGQKTQQSQPEDQTSSTEPPADEADESKIDTSVPESETEPPVPGSGSESPLPLAPGPVIIPATNSSSDQQSSASSSSDESSSEDDNAAEAYTDTVVDSTSSSTSGETGGHLLETDEAIKSETAKAIERVLGHGSSEDSRHYGSMPALPVSPTPLAPKSKLGKVLSRATADVERLMRGKAPVATKPPPEPSKAAGHSVPKTSTTHSPDTGGKSSTSPGGNPVDIMSALSSDLPAFSSDDITISSQITEPAVSPGLSTMPMKPEEQVTARSPGTQAAAALSAAQHALEALPSTEQTKHRLIQDNTLQRAQEPQSVVSNAARFSEGWLHTDAAEDASLVQAPPGPQDKALHTPHRNKLGFKSDLAHQHATPDRNSELRSKAAAAKAEWEQAKLKEEEFLQKQL